MTVYAKFEGINGSVTDKKYLGAIEIASYQLEVKKHMTHQLGTGSNRTIGNPKHSTILLTKDMDAASTDLLQRFYKNTCIPSVTFYHLTTTTSAHCYIQRTFKNVIIRGINESNDECGSTEEIEMIFASTEKRVTTLNNQNKANSPKSVSYDPSK